MPITKDDVLRQLRKVNDPELHRDLVTLNRVKNVAICDGLVSLTIEHAGQDQGVIDAIKRETLKALLELGKDFKELKVDFAAPTKPTPQQAAAANNPLPGVKHIVAVGAGKGGVGKSTIAVNLAVGLARLGLRAGLLDGDIYGPSAPTLLGIEGRQPQVVKDQMIPFEVHGIRAITMGALVEPERPLIWRGPMAHGAFRDLSTRTIWGDLDYLIIDLPPGTGDVPLTMSQILPLAGAVVVCTPQKVAQDDARRAVRMFQQLNIEVLGVVENMSYFIADDGKEYDIFGRGGAEKMAQEMGVPFLGAVPINMALRANSDAGTPVANFTGSPTLAGELEAVVRRLQGQVNLHTADARPTLNVS
ncbi:MAG: Mrp/NBP35 family ATP-binding protein [Planctomycetota bacterium]|nr:Mrp/NBP35 family ATP-binding protein [Planctomycetota bacterium]